MRRALFNRLPLRLIFPAKPTVGVVHTRVRGKRFLEIQNPLTDGTEEVFIHRTAEVVAQKQRILKYEVEHSNGG